MVVEATKSLWNLYRETTSNRIVRAMDLLRELGAFALITLGVSFTKFGVARRVVHPLILLQIQRAGVALLPMVAFVGAALGLVVVGQTVALLSKVGAEQYIGTVMVTVVMRELAPLLTAVLVLARAGTANVVELGTARALGEVEALESMGIDPIHYLVIPRVIGLATAVFCLALYLVGTTFIFGYIFVFLHDVAMPAREYFGRLGVAMRWEDFPLFAMKTLGFGVILAVVNCYHGLARPLRVGDVAEVTGRAVVECVAGCLLLDALFILAYLLI